MVSFYLTTPIFYVNGAPHIGHAYTALTADLFARHYRQRSQEVYFLTGTDEHGLKIQRSAEAQGVSPKELADTNAAIFRRLFDALDITYDRFLRTTDADHRETVQEMVRRLVEKGAIYESAYEGWYAASDEAYYDESEVEDGRSKVSGASVEWIKEPSFFFRLSAYQDALLAWYDENPHCILPSSRFNEVRSFVAGGLKDLSISRSTFDWGIPFPDQPGHVLYVWIDALTNYLTGVGGFAQDHPLSHHWPCDLHLIGKDILRFHAVYWPAFLMAAGLPLPKQIFAHGWWLNEGEKMSKSRGNFIDAFELVDRYDQDLIRYYLIREVPLGNDGNFCHERIAQRNNSELADNLGNLVSRSLAMLQKFLGGKVPAARALDRLEPCDVELRSEAEQARTDLCDLMDSRRPGDALERVMQLSAALNLYCVTTKPWAIAKSDDLERLEVVMGTLLHGVAWVAHLAAPFLPATSAKILTAFGVGSPGPLSELNWDLLPVGSSLSSIDLLFTKFDMDAVRAEVEAKQGGSSTGGAPAESATAGAQQSKSSSAGGVGANHAPAKVADPLPQISFDAFKKVDIRCGQIVSAAKIKGAKKLLQLEVDLGEGRLRQVVAGIGKHYQPEELLDLRIAVVANLEPATIYGIESEGMLLAVDTEDGGLMLTVYPPTVPLGAQVG